MWDKNHTTMQIRIVSGFWFRRRSGRLKINIRCPGDGVPKACHQLAATDSWGSRTCVCANTFWAWGGPRRGRRSNSCSAVVMSGRRGKNLQLDARKRNRAARKGKWSPRGTRMTVLTCPGMRPGNRQGWWKRSTFRWDGRQLTLDKTVGSWVWWHTQFLGRLRINIGWETRATWLRGRCRVGHRPVVLLCC